MSLPKISLIADTILNSDGIQFNSSNLQQDTLQDDYLVTDTFSTLLNLQYIDQNDLNDSTTMNSTFSVSGNVLTINKASGTDYRTTAVSNRYNHGRNKLIKVTLGSGGSANTPIIFSRFTSISDTALMYINPGDSKIHYQIQGTGSTDLADGISIGSFNSSTQYLLTLKTFENLSVMLIQHPSTLKVMRHYSVYNNNFLDKTGARNGLGMSATNSPFTVNYTNLKSRDMSNFTNIVCIGDSNTAANWIGGGIDIIDQGNSYTEILNQKYIDKNIVVTNQGISGDNSTNVLARINNIVACYIPGARNIATILLGTNDAGETNGMTYNFATTQSNFNNIIATLKLNKFEVWVMLYPPRNQNTTPGANSGTTPPDQTTMNTQNIRVAQINGFLKSLTIVDKIIPLDTYFTDLNATVTASATLKYFNCYSNLVDVANTRASNGYIHFVEAGHTVIANVIASSLEKESNSIPSLKSLNISKNININNFGVFGNINLGAPSLTTRSIGSRIILYPSVSGASVDFGMGIESGAMWYSVSTASDLHKFYNGTTNTISLNTTALTSAVQIRANNTSTPYNSTTGADVSGTLGGINNTGQYICSGTNTTGNINNSLIFAKSGLGDPSNSSRSLGTRIILYPTLTAGSTCDFAIGINSGSYIWYGVSGITDTHRFFHNTSLSLTVASDSLTLSSGMKFATSKSTGQSPSPVANTQTITFTPANLSGTINVNVTGLLVDSLMSFSVTHSFVVSTSTVMVTPGHDAFYVSVNSVGSGTFTVYVRNIGTVTGGGNINIFFFIVS